MAGKSKSSENKENSKDNEERDASQESVKAESSDGESTPEEPVVIEGEATLVGVDDEESPAKDEVEAVSEGGTQQDSATDGSDEEPHEISSEPSDTRSSEVEQLPQPQTEQTSSGNGASVLALVFGGIVAGAIGYFASALAPDPETPAFDDTQLNAGIASNAAALAELENSLSALQNAPAPELDLSGVEAELGTITRSLEAMTSDLSALEGALTDSAAALDTRMTELDERIVALETAVPAAGELATDDELRALRSRIEDMMGEAEARLAEAQAEAEAIAQEAAELRAAAEAEALEVAAAAEARATELQAITARQTALVELKTAVETGAGYAELLSDLGSVPDALSAHAANGVPTIRALQESFPTAARAALSQSVTVAEDASTGERFTAFLKRRTNARSLTEQPGDSPDAVLSRAEARLGEGDLAAAVAELDSLPEAGKAALQDWLEQASTRISAVAALDELTATN